MRYSMGGNTSPDSRAQASQIGKSVGVVFSQEVLTVLKAQEGDSLQVTEAADGSIRLKTVKLEVSKQMKIGQDIMERYRSALGILAK
jgi:putative addiction module antidote